MDATLAFFYVPVQDIKRAEAFYRQDLKLEESWRVEDSTIAFRLPGGQVELVLDQVEDRSLSAGPALQVPSVNAWYAAQQGKIQFPAPPSDIPGGRWLAAIDGAGSNVYFVDQQDAGQ